MHIDKNCISNLNESLNFHIMINFRKFTKMVEHNMATKKLCSILIEAISDHNWNIIHPCIARRCTQKNPTIVCCNFIKRFHPSAATNYSLFIKQKECIFNTNVFSNIIPTINNWIKTKYRSFFLPICTITLSCCSDNIQIFFNFHWRISRITYNRALTASDSREDITQSR